MTKDVSRAQNKKKLALPQLVVWDVRDVADGIHEEIAEQLIALNDECATHVGELDSAKIAYFYEHAHHFLVAASVRNRYEIHGFLIAFSDDSRYAKPYYSWFLQHYPHFIFVDRIVVEPPYKRKEVGLHLMWRLLIESQKHHIPVLTAVNFVPKNSEGLGFFLNGMDGDLIGSEVITEDLTVSYFKRVYTLADLTSYVERMNSRSKKKLIKIIETSLPKEVVKALRDSKEAAQNHADTDQKQHATENLL